MPERIASINCEIDCAFGEDEVRKLQDGWNTGFCKKGGPGARVRKLPEGINPGGIECSLCPKCLPVTYTVGGK